MSVPPKRDCRIAECSSGERAVADAFGDLGAFSIGSDGLGVLLFHRPEVAEVVQDGRFERGVAAGLGQVEALGQVGPSRLQLPDRDGGVTEARQDDRRLRRPARFLGKRQGGLESLDRSSILAERGMGLGEVHQCRALGVGLPRPFVQAHGFTQARHRVFECAALEGLQPLLEVLLRRPGLDRPCRVRERRRHGEQQAGEYQRSNGPASHTPPPADALQAVSSAC